MANDGDSDNSSHRKQYEQTNVIILDDDTEEEIGAISGRSPPIPAVGDLVSLHNFQLDTSNTTARPRKEENMSFRVVDRALHYSASNDESDGGDLTTEVLLYVVSKEEWIIRRQRGT
jgi:hypothetical protein